METTLGARDRYVVDASLAPSHQAVLVKLPLLVAVRAKPVVGVVVPLVLEANRDAVVVERPKLLDEPVIELFRPFALEEGDDAILH